MSVAPNLDTARLSTGVALPAPTATVKIISHRTYDGVDRGSARETRTAEEWTWMDLRDYVISSIEKLNGPFPRDNNAMTGIFKGFMTRWGPKARIIAEYAFEVEHGVWRGAPIGPGRFMAKSDPWFAEVIIDRLTKVAATITDW